MGDVWKGVEGGGTYAGDVAVEDRAFAGDGFDDAFSIGCESFHGV